MEIEEITQLKLTKDNFIKIEPERHYLMEKVTIDNHQRYKDSLERVIYYLNDQLVWDGIPTYEESIERLKKGSVCFIFYYNGLSIGWNWVNQNVMINWKDVDKQLNGDECYFGGIYVSNRVFRPDDAGMININMFFNECFKLGYQTLYGYSDNWNKRPIKLMKENGCVVESFL